MAHSGPSARGSFIQTLVLTDIATGWTECAPLIVREQTLLSTVLTELRKQLPFALLGLDTDNDTVFIGAVSRPQPPRRALIVGGAGCIVVSAAARQ